MVNGNMFKISLLLKANDHSHQGFAAKCRLFFALLVVDDTNEIQERDRVKDRDRVAVAVARSPGVHLQLLWGHVIVRVVLRAVVPTLAAEDTQQQRARLELKKNKRAQARALYVLLWHYHWR